VGKIGGRLISKRISQFLEASNPSAHILVEEHPFRTDPSHILTHRIQCDTADFVSTIMGSIPASAEPLPFCHFLPLLSQAVCHRSKQFLLYFRKGLLILSELNEVHPPM